MGMSRMLIGESARGLAHSKTLREFESAVGREAF